MIKFLADLRARFRLLPLLIVVASLAFVVRIGDAASEFRALSNEAVAAEAAAAKTEDKKPEGATAQAKPPADPPADPPAQPQVQAPSLEPPTTAQGEKIMPDAADTDIDNSALREDVYKDLLTRRQQIEAKEQELAKREALIKATSQEMDQKMKELTALRDEIQGLLKKQSGEEQANTQRLVKIYEGMKPKDAARIFNTLDMDILLNVVSNMSERKSAPIIAQMDPERARSLTLFLAEQRQLPKESDTPSIPTNASVTNPSAAQ